MMYENRNSFDAALRNEAGLEEIKLDTRIHDSYPKLTTFFIGFKWHIRDHVFKFLASF